LRTLELLQLVASLTIVIYNLHIFMVLAIGFPLFFPRIGPYKKTNLPMRISRSFESNLARSLVPRIPPMAQTALETQAA
jgi:hypothetical protein